MGSIFRNVIFWSIFEENVGRSAWLARLGKVEKVKVELRVAVWSVRSAATRTRKKSRKFQFGGGGRKLRVSTPPFGWQANFQVPHATGSTDSPTLGYMKEGQATQRRNGECLWFRPQAWVRIGGRCEPHFHLPSSPPVLRY